MYMCVCVCEGGGGGVWVWVCRRDGVRFFLFHNEILVLLVNF